MNQSKFDLQISRLKNVFGDKAYADERVKLIWGEARNVSDQVFESVINRLIGEERYPPLLAQIRDALSAERERNWGVQKEKHKKEAEDFVKNIFDGDLIQSICKTITQRVEGLSTDESFGSFVSGLKRLPPGRVCIHCEDSGLVFWRDPDGYEWTYRCVCLLGHQKPRSYPSYQSVLDVKRICAKASSTERQS